MANDGSSIVLVFLHKLFSTRESDLVDVFVDLLGRHTDTTVRDGDRLVVELHANGQVAQLPFELTY